MKTKFHSLALAVGCWIGLFVFPDFAQSQNFYLDADVGAALARDVSLHRFVVPTPGAKLKLDPGARLSVAAGYNFNQFIGAQIETGFIFNNVNSTTGGGSIDAGVAHAPLLANAVLRYDQPDCKWVPYAGAGAGGDASMIALDHVRARNGSVVDGSGSTVVFAWQAFTGVRYKFAQNMSVGAGYKFFAADGASWDVRHASGDIKTGTAEVHSLLLDFTFSF